MTTTSPIGSSTASSATSSLAGSSLNISPTQFLKLITAQMTDQNPLNPSDPTQFLSQLEGLSEVSSMQSMQSSLQSSQVLTGTSLLGHSVLVSGNTANLASGGTVSGAISAPAGASSLTVQITNSSGNVVKTMTLTPDSSGGLTNFKWDGTNSTGSAAPPGQYTVNVAASVNGAGQLVTPLISSTVNSVTLDPSTKALELNTNNGTVALSSVAAVL